VRHEISADELNLALTETQRHMATVVNRHGPRAFASRHEVESVVRGECRELGTAIDTHADMDAIRHELLDIAVACIFGVACIDAGTLDW